MIPKTIHYCWFGRNPKSKLVKKCIRTWRSECPDYNIIEWNEDNYDISAAPLYVQQAYQAKKWAFVSDYVRLQVVYENGGVYLDTDVEVIRNLDTLLDNRAYFGFETESTVNTGLGFGAEKGSAILRDFMEEYLGIPFYSPDGKCDVTPCPERNTAVLLAHGLLADNREQLLDGYIHIYPKTYFCPKDYKSGETFITSDTFTIHHFDASWHTPFEKYLRMKQRRFRKKYGADEGKKRMDQWRRRHKIMIVLFQEGPNILMRKAFRKIRRLRR